MLAPRPAQETLQNGANMSEKEGEETIVASMRALVHKGQCALSISASDKIVNDECAYTFDGPLKTTQQTKEDGIFVNMKTLCAVSRKYLRMDSMKTENQGLYLKRRFRKVFIEDNDGKSEDEEMTTGDDASTAKREKKEITKLGIGVEGGFGEEDAKPKFTLEKDERIVVYDCEKDSIAAEMKVDFESQEVQNALPTVVFECAKTI